MGLVVSMGMDYRHFLEHLYIHHPFFSCYSCLLGLDVFNGMDYGHFIENCIFLFDVINMLGCGLDCGHIPEILYIHHSLLLMLAGLGCV